MSNGQIGPMFIDRESGVTIRVEAVNDAFAQITVVMTLQKHWSAPVAWYDTEFVKRYLPLDTGAMAKPDNYRPPANADYWEQEKVEAAKAAEEAAARGETDAGVRIGEPDAPEQEQLQALA